MLTQLASGTDYFWERGGELGRLIRDFDWSKTPLGPIESWPQSLKTAVGIMLISRQPIWIGWGESLIFLYNDPYKSIIGGKHPHMLGQPTAVVWREIWDVIGPMLETAMSGEEGTYVESQLLIMERYGFREETYYTFSYTPIPDDHGRPGGIICANTEDTQRRIAGRQMALLRELAAKTAEARTWKEACERSAEALRSNDRDLPFALIYLAQPESPELELAGSCGIAADHPAAPRKMISGDTAPWPFTQALEMGDTLVLDELPSTLVGQLPTGGWKEAPSKVALLPIAGSGATGPSGLLVVGLNPFRLFDDDYRNFLTLVAGQISASIAGAHTYEEERRRAEALRELDRAKTAFFSNVSHEFRTPLTLILGPSEQLLSGALGETNEIQREHLTTLQRNAVRLQKLVNTLLDFARVEAGRLEAKYEPVDIGLLTRDLGSTFSSALHRAGLLYIMNCPSIDEPVYVDRDMWEKIVLNLLSNALKFTFAGTIEVSLAAKADHVELTVRDTGAGIAKEELAHLFERFYRVPKRQARTQEGSGIGLALVQELVRLHGGSIKVESEVDKGTTFTVAIPKGMAHLPKDRLGSERSLSTTALGAAPFVEEALSWLPGSEPADRVAEPVSAAGLVDAPRPIGAPVERILIADDNLEMRNYLKRLLETRWQVTAVEDGAKALAAARQQRPDLVLSDVMMPRLTGFELLRGLRDDPNTSTIPVILLSARAGDEAYIEGLSAGADDYIVKPFGARELIARVKALLEVTRVRRESERRITGILESITDGFQVIDADWRLTYMNTEAKRVFAEHGIDPEWAIGKHFWNEIFPTGADSEAAAHQRRAMTERVPVFFETFFAPWRKWFSVRVYPLPEGGVANYFQDISEYREAEKAKAWLAAIIESSTDAIVGKDLAGVITSWNHGAERLFGYTAAEAVGQPVTILIPAERLDEEPHILDRVRRGERIEHYETVRRRKDGTLLDVSLSVSPVFDAAGRVVGASKIARDITERKRVEQALRESEQRFRLMADSSPIMVWMTDAAGRTSFLNRACLEYFGVPAEAAATFDWSERVHGDDRDDYRGVFRGALKSGGGLHARARLLRRDGEWRWFESRGSPVLDETGKMIAFIGSSLDITEIYESRQALKELGQRKDEFLANMSHEIRSPLTAIMGYADILLDKLHDPADIECLKTIKESGDYLIEIVNDILDLSKIEAGKMVLNIEPVGIFALLSEVQNLMAGRAKLKRLSLGLRYEGVLPESIRTDRTRLRQILINLVSNGIKFTERGRVDIVARMAAELLQIEVIDTGIGIAPEHQAVLFQPFTQADTTSTREYGGTGLGLTITKRLVEMLGGAISFESEPGRGSTFRVAVPVGAAVEAYPPRRPLPELREIRPGEGTLRDRRVLVVDDRDEICYLISRYIREAGGQTEEANEGEKALEAIGAAGNQPFDAVVLDIHMPGMDGYDVARALRAQGSHLPIIALTAGAMVGDREKCLAAGFDDYLTKPIDRRKLVELVAEHTRARVELGAHQRVLVVDDSHNACTFLSLFLEKRGYQVRAAHDGESALAAAWEFRPGVVVLDIRLPDMDGFELMRQLKQLDGIDRAKFIGLSGYRDGAQRYDGFDHFLEKPVDTAHLIALLRDFSG